MEEGQGAQDFPLGRRQKASRTQRYQERRWHFWSKTDTARCWPLKALFYQRPVNMSTLATKSTGQWAWPQLPRLLISCSVPASAKAPFTCTSEASVLCVSFRQCQFCRPRVSAMLVLTVCARAGSIMDTYWSSRGWGIMSWEMGEKGNHHACRREGQYSWKTRWLELKCENSQAEM